MLQEQMELLDPLLHITQKKKRNKRIHNEVEETKDQRTEVDMQKSKHGFAGTPIQTKDENDNKNYRENSRKKG